jgi:hypothetical protein
MVSQVLRDLVLMRRQGRVVMRRVWEGGTLRLGINYPVTKIWLR